MRNFIILTLFFLSLTSCTNNAYVALNDVESGMFLERASLSSVNSYFNYRMMNNAKKSKDWVTVNEDTDFIYYGQIVKNGNFVLVKPFYKVNRTELLQKFPGYHTLTGKQIKAKVYQTYVKPVLEQHLINICPQSYQVAYGKREYRLTSEGIAAKIAFTGKCYETKMIKANINVLLNPENLDEINQDINIK